MSIDETYIYGEKWTSTFTLKNADGDIVDGSDVRIRIRAQYDGTTYTYALGSDSEVVQTGSGVYEFSDPTLSAGVYDAEWQAFSTNAERTRVCFRIKDDLTPD